MSLTFYLTLNDDVMTIKVFQLLLDAVSGISINKATCLVIAARFEFATICVTLEVSDIIAT